MNAPLRSLLDHAPVLQPGEVWLAGAGPGDPGHLTLFALAGLMQADCIVHDALVDARVLALAPQAMLVPAGKRGGRPSWQQADITARLIALARDKRRVLRLKGGDPNMFGRGGEEAIALAEHGIPFRVIPGLTAGLAGLAAAAIPATVRGVNQAIVLATGHDTDGATSLDWAALARLDQPIVLYMGFTHLPRIAAALIDGGMRPDMPAAAIAAATLPQQRVVTATLHELAGAVRDAGLATPVLVAIGRIVTERARLEALLPVATEALRWPVN